MSAISLLARYWHTLKFLKPIQIYGRLWHHLYRPKPRKIAPMPLRTPSSRWTGCARSPTLLNSDHHFRFLNVERVVNLPKDWSHPEWPKLWLYNLHYFDDLVADRAGERATWHRNLIESWIAHQESKAGVGSEPYPTSLRLVNWCKWLSAGNEPVKGMLPSLCSQADLLYRKPEYHLLGNHLWANLKALIFCGVVFEGEDSDRWLKFALKKFRQQLSEQILPDGGHFERSPMYHAILLEDLLDLVQLNRLFPHVLPATDVAVWSDQAASMLRWLETMSHPDGDLSFFNDAAFGIAPTVSQLATYAKSLGIEAETHTQVASGLTDLPDSGYIRLEHGESVVLIDGASVGPDHLPGHAHADTLSFEWSFDGHRVLVNGGTSTYEKNPERHRQRGTASHNTVQVDDQDSSEVWSGFRVARRAKIIKREVPKSFQSKCQSISVAAVHDGYHRLPGRVQHQRAWHLDDQCLSIVDHLDGAWDKAVARFRLSPEVNCRQATDKSGHITIAERQISWVIEGASRIQIVKTTWHPEFGITKPCNVLEAEFRSADLVTRFHWI